jgi:hypothetical protein
MLSGGLRHVGSPSHGLGVWLLAGGGATLVHGTCKKPGDWACSWMHTTRRETPYLLGSSCECSNLVFDMYCTKGCLLHPH